MKTIKLLLCVLLTAMSLNVFADEGRYQMIFAPDDGDGYVGVFVLDTKTGGVKFCFRGAPKSTGMICFKNMTKTTEKIN